MSLWISRTACAAPATPVTVPTPAPAPADQGEEVYAPKTADKPEKDSNLDSESEEEDQTLQKEDPNKKLKEFNKKENSVQGTGVGGASVSDSGNKEEVQAEKEIDVEANKLVDVDDKTVETKKYSGLLWFIGVFFALLVVIFSFT